MRLRIVDEREMESALDAAIRRGLCECFPGDIGVFSGTRAWHGSAPAFSAIIERRGRIIAHAGVVDRMIAAGDERLRIAGVQSVFVLPGHRGGGLSGRVLKTAMDEGLRRRMDGGLLFCLPGMAKIYARTGWAILPARPVWAQRGDGSRYLLDGKNLLMFHPLMRRSFPDGPIELNGDDW
jgi:GNAT superfamily N-acetyltransferase